MAHQLPQLPYAMNALQPHISAETLEYHYGRHHRKYVDTLNERIRGTKFESVPLDQIITTAPAGPIFNNAAQVWNHTFYWNSLHPEGGGEPEGPLASAVHASFDSYVAFKEQFAKACIDLFGSGWVWLVKESDSSVAIMPTKDADNPLKHGRIALLAFDMWEHAYYIDYRNQKGKYLDAFWNLVDWKFAAERFASQAERQRAGR